MTERLEVCESVLVMEVGGEAGGAGQVHTANTSVMLELLELRREANFLRQRLQRCATVTPQSHYSHTTVTPQSHYSHTT
eukprot:1018648-Pyramimonas_sp.AAC.1